MRKLLLKSFARRLCLSAFAVSCFTTLSAQHYLRTNSGQYVPVSDISNVKIMSVEDESSLSVLLDNDDKISIYKSALDLTGVMDLLKVYKDPTYTWANEKDIIDSCTWTNNALCSYVSAEYDNTAYPVKRLYDHTVFVVKDEILKEKYNITKLRGKDDTKSLEHLAHQIYDEVYPEDANIDDYKNAKNALNRFISYHILNVYGSYYKLTAFDNNELQNHFNRKKIDIADWYETLMPNSLMKISIPSTPQGDFLYINRRGVQSKPDDRGVFVEGSKVEKEGSTETVNGVYYYIQDIVHYGKQTQQVVLNERMRFDATTLSPDFMSLDTDGEMPRGHKTDGTDDRDLYYGVPRLSPEALSNINHCKTFKPGFVRNFEFNDNTHIHIRNRYQDFWLYQGDEVVIKGNYDVTMKLPSLPEGKYELRFGTCIGFAAYGSVQFYIDSQQAGDPFDLLDRDYYENLKTDKELGTQEAIDAYDKELRAKRCMKGPASYQSGHLSHFDADRSTFRDQAQTTRRIIGTFTTDGKSDHYLRFKSADNSERTFNLDYIEIVPESVYNNNEYAEDIY